jgi:precorrin-2 dehydrogenase / sirohydrochlorin ferrochelatase
MTRHEDRPPDRAGHTVRPPVVPVALVLRGRTVLVVGGGPIAARKARDFLTGGARVRVVAPRVVSEIRALLADTPFLTIVERIFEESDLDGVHLVVTATGDAGVDAHVSKAADTRGLLVNAADDPENCTFYLTSVVRRGPIAVSVSTSGASPALASYLRRRLDSDLEDALATLADVLGEERREFHRRGVSTESLAWTSVVNDDLVDLAVAGRWDDVRDRVRQLEAPT